MRKRSYILPLLFAISSTLRITAQLDVRPSEWKTFVNSNSNILVVDTFRFQRFDPLLLSNWDYHGKNGTVLFDAGKEGIKGQQGQQSLKVPLGGEVVFDRIDISEYKDVCIRVSYAASKVVKNENLSVRILDREDKERNIGLAEITTETPVSFNYGEKFRYSNPVSFGSFPTQIAFTASSPSSSSRNGYYAINWVVAHGEIEQYSLFEGKGNWEDVACWSHLPASRGRKALIQGKVSVLKDQTCNNIEIGAGELFVDKNAKLTITNNLVIHSTSAFNGILLNKGKLNIKGKVTIHKEFPQKGVWYFISFPFDVYASEIPSFTLKGENPNAGGNYFYVKYYNAKKRANSGLDTDNWTTLSSVASTTPVFEKNKGYLIALDEAATTTKMSFSSRKNVLPEDFARNASLSFPFYPASSEVSPAHAGWCLCGNPFPAPMPLRLLSSASNIGQYAYCYDGNTYQVHEIKSDVVIPPLGAFFLKLTDNCSLDLAQTQALSKRNSTTSGIPSFVLQLTDGTRTDKTIFLLDTLPNLRKDVDRNAYKFLSLDPTMPQIASYQPVVKNLLAIQSLEKDSVCIPLFVYIGRSGTHTLTFTFPNSSVKANRKISLIDHFYQDTISLQQQKSYVFNESAGKCEDRFSLLTELSVDPLDGMSDSSVEVKCYTKDKRLFIENLPSAGYVQLVNEQGIICQRIHLPKGNSISFMSVREGNYSFMIEAGNYKKEVITFIAQ
ncbi:hypothetical protein [Parabacteroides pacaensis]|uniref:hypothetical protein n=1 Tax=Parabacteroides pacaensis TaxID=2086575 RepID=UPI000D105B4D|nr:hypothetical protein [Parabacteroides pacaensis]